MRKLLFAFVLAMLLVPAFAFAVTPNPGHAAYTVGPGMNGSFYNGNYTFPNNLNVTKNLTVLSNLCLGGVCYASWPAGSSMWTNSSGNATFTAGNVGIGTTTPTEKLTLDNGSILITAPGTGRARGTLANLNPGSSYLNEVYVSGRYAYIADSWYNMSIVDVSDPDYPRRISMFDVTGARSVLSIGTTLYVGTGAGLNVLDIQNPAAPVSRATLNIGFDAASIVAAGRYLYVVGDNNTNTSLGIVDVVNQTNPVLAGSITLANWEQIEFANVEVQGDVAYVTNGYQFYLINITTPSAPTILANYSTGYVSDIVVIGSYAYAGGWGQGFKTFDISNTSRITLLDTDASPQITQLVVAGRYAYGITSTGGNNRTVIYDVSNASDIIEIGSINLSAAPNIIEIQGKYLYIGTANALEIIEIPGIDAPTAQLGTLETEQALVNGRLIVDGEAMFSSGVAVGSRGISSIGSISAGNGLSVAGTTNLSGITHTPQLCLNGDCRTAWPTSSANVTSTANGSANYYARFTTTGNIQTGLLSDNGTALVLGATLISTGGNGRGLYATDLQIDRASVTQVASGDYGTLSGGNQNTVAGAYGTVSGGTANNLGTNSAQGTIGGGQGNINNGSVGTIAGGSSNIIRPTYGFIGGGVSNVLQTGAYSVIGGGLQNSITSGTGYSSILGGQNNSVTGGYATVVNGQYSNVTNNYGFIGAGQYNVVNGSLSGIVSGEGLVAQAYGSLVSGRFNTIQGTIGSPTIGDRVFVIGNGTSLSNRDTAFYVTNNGSVWTGGSVTTPSLCLNGDCRTSWPSSGGSGNISGGVGSTNGNLAFFNNATMVNGTASLFWDNVNSRLSIAGDNTPAAALTVGASDAFQVTSAGYTYMPAGTNSLPSLSFTTDTNSGFYSGGADNIRLATGAVDRLIIDSAGRVGINITNPAYSLDVNGSANISQVLHTPQICLNGDCKTAWNVTTGAGTVNGYIALWNNGSVINGTSTLRLIENNTFAIYNDTGGHLARFNGTNNSVSFGNTDNNITVRIHGNLQVSSAVTSNMGFDFAESFVALEDMEPGDLVMAVNRNSVRKATRDDAAFVIGAVSTSPGIVITDPSVPNQKAIGLAGRIPVKVTGVVQRGDFITVSDIPGVGMAAREPSFVIGRAIDEVDANGMVFMVIQPSYFSPQVDVNNELLGGKRGRVFEAGLAVRENAGAGGTATAGRPRGQDRVVELGASDDIVVTLG